MQLAFDILHAAHDSVVIIITPLTAIMKDPVGMEHEFDFPGFPYPRYMYYIKFINVGYKIGLYLYIYNTRICEESHVASDR